MKSGKTIIALASALLLGAAGTGLWLASKPGQSSGPSASHPQSPISNPPSLPLHPVVTRILREGPDLPYLKFNYLIKELPLNLAAHDIQALITFISAPAPAKFQDAEWGSLVNDIEECLTVQTLPSPQVAQALIAIFRDPQKIQMQRDYALQHIGGFAIYLIHTGVPTSVGQPPSSSPPTIHSQLSTLPPSSPSTIHSQPSTLLPLLLNELKSAAAHSSQPWSGTALNLLDGLLRAATYRAVDIPGLDAASLVEIAIPIARDPSAPLNARLPALQVAARHDSPAARDLARQILATPDSSLMLIQSASAALAAVGTAADLPLLHTATVTATRHTAPALNEAIRAIQNRSRPH